MQIRIFFMFYTWCVIIGIRDQYCDFCTARSDNILTTVRGNDKERVLRYGFAIQRSEKCSDYNF